MNAQHCNFETEEKAKEEVEKLLKLLKNKDEFRDAAALLADFASRLWVFAISFLELQTVAQNVSKIVRSVPAEELQLKAI